MLGNHNMISGFNEKQTALCMTISINNFNGLHLENFSCKI
jgi:hypothetical protein